MKHMAVEDVQNGIYRTVRECRTCALLGPYVLLTLGLMGCAALGLGRMTPQQRAQYVEPMLTAAGFQIIPASEPEKTQHLSQLPPFQLKYYVGENGKLRYWFADPTFCRCLYLGDERAYQKYQELRLKAKIAQANQEAAERNYEASQEMQMDMMSPFGFGFGPSLGFGF